MQFVVILLSLLSLSFTIKADDSSSSNSTSSVFVYTDTQSDHEQFVFALNVEQDTGDLYLHMSCPAGNSWMGVGIGDQMTNALMFVAYASGNGSGVTLSPRLATGHSEPSYYDKVHCDLVYADEYFGGNAVTDSRRHGLGGAMTVNAVCHNATDWGVGRLPIAANLPTDQPFIFAVGPGEPLDSDSPSANMRRHNFVGHFTMDMNQAVVKENAQVPLPNGTNDSYVLSGASAATSTKQDNDPASGIHAFIMCVTFVIIFPAGALALRMLNRVKLHAIMQSVGLVLVCMATAGGIKVATLYNKSKHFASAHQIIGILVLLALFAQLGLGILNHRSFKQTGKGTILGKIHRYLGPAIILLGIVNAPLGFVFAGNPHLCLPYLVVLVMFIIVYCVVRFASKICCGARLNKMTAPPEPDQDMPGPGAGQGYQYPHFQFGSEGTDTASGAHMQPAPAYARQPYDRQPSDYGQSKHDVQLRPYESYGSGMLGTVGQQPRPMV